MPAALHLQRSGIAKLRDGETGDDELIRRRGDGTAVVLDHSCSERLACRDVGRDAQTRPVQGEDGLRVGGDFDCNDPTRMRAYVTAEVRCPLHSG